jgi:hypothetical protein
MRTKTVVGCAKVIGLLSSRLLSKSYCGTKSYWLILRVIFKKPKKVTTAAKICNFCGMLYYNPWGLLHYA